jgi:hypothetical protein
MQARPAQGRQLRPQYREWLRAISGSDPVAYYPNGTAARQVDGLPLKGEGLSVTGRKDPSVRGWADNLAFNRVGRCLEGAYERLALGKNVLARH